LLDSLLQESIEWRKVEKSTSRLNFQESDEEQKDEEGEVRVT